MSRTRLPPSNHLFDGHPFEVFYRGSWQPVERLRINKGAVAFHFVDYGLILEEKGLMSTLRLRPRRACISDCSCFLRPGVDICVLSPTQPSPTPWENPRPVISFSPWLNMVSPEKRHQRLVRVEARISSVERRPHNPECNCIFYVKLLTVEDHSGHLKGKQGKEIFEFGLDQINIFQRLPLKPGCESKHYRWGFAEDCSEMQKTKLHLGKFSADVSWMVVASVHKQFTFDIRSVQNKLVYQILDDEYSNCSSDVHLSALNFKLQGDVVIPIVFPYASSDILEFSPVDEEEINEDIAVEAHDLSKVRRSKRRNVKPDRYLGDIGLEEADISHLRLGWKSLKPDEDEGGGGGNGGERQELPLLLSNEAGDGTPDEDHCEQSLRYEICQQDPEETAEKKSGSCDVRKKKRAKWTSSGDTSRKKARAGENQPKSPVKEMDQSNNKKTHFSENIKSQPNHHATPRSNDPKRNHNHTLALISSQTQGNQISAGQQHSQSEMRAENLGEDIPLKYYFRRRKKRDSEVVKSKNLAQLDYPEDNVGWTGRSFCSPKQKDPWDDVASPSSLRPLRKRGRPSLSFSSMKRDFHSEASGGGGGGKKNLDAGEYKEIISAYMKNIQLTIENKLPECRDPLKQLLGDKEAKAEQEKQEKEVRKDTKTGEDAELDVLWKEMDLALAAIYLEGQRKEEAEELYNRYSASGNGTCEHVFKLDDEIGLICSLCGYIGTEIGHITAEFWQSQSSGSIPKRDRSGKDDLEHKLIDEVGVEFVTKPFSADLRSSNEHVWTLVPHMREKLHPHQKKAFEFLWKNLAGSLVPSKMEAKKKKIGGCVISHTPGAGKTFLIIAFLVSYLKLNPGKRPLVLAPKTTLYTWYKEIIKWKFPVPVYQIHGRKTYRDRIYMKKLENRTASSANIIPSGDVMHILDCLEKLQKWHAHPSVLLMGYTSFMTLIREDSKYAYRRYMGQILRESPGILILDEGHNPRSTKSRLRKALMKIKTDLRILLSGTLFQNNFGEYFNTLCLARPKFVDEALKVLDPKYKKRIKGMNKTRTSIENRARKVFMDIIAEKINSKDPVERMDGLTQLKNMTNKFIDVYEGGASENLPGLQSYTLMMKLTPTQQEILVKLHSVMKTCKGFPLELELMITLGSIHPWLIKTAVCAPRFFTAEELLKLDEHKLDPTKGSKVKFVLGLVHRCIVRMEKVLIFCHNIAPINLFLELFGRIYGWVKGQEVLVLSGELELFERGKVMDKFEERNGPSRVMLASINACAEGISLTAASRVILLDSEWNPSKQKQAIARAFRPGQEKVVHVYQLLGKGTLEEDKYRRTTWKEWMSCMIFSEEQVEDPSRWQAEKIEDELLREIFEEDHATLFHQIMKNEKTSYENPLKVAE